jgi:hypothetical protein
MGTGWFLFIVFLLMINLISAPNICDPFDPCGCGKTSCESELDLDLRDNASTYQIIYDDKGIGVKGCSNMLWESGHVTLACQRSDNVSLVVCEGNKTPAGINMKVCANSSCDQFYIQKSEICRNRPINKSVGEPACGLPLLMILLLSVNVLLPDFFYQWKRQG